jgi:hypothetical protein
MNMSEKMKIKMKLNVNVNCFNSVIILSIVFLLI